MEDRTDHHQLPDRQDQELHRPSQRGACSRRLGLGLLCPVLPFHLHIAVSIKTERLLQAGTATHGTCVVLVDFGSSSFRLDQQP